MILNADSSVPGDKEAARARGGTMSSRQPVPSVSDVRPIPLPGRPRVARSGAAPEASGEAAIGLVFALLAIALIYRALLTGRVVAGGDLQLYFYPYWVAMVRAIRDGGSMFWNPFLFAGAPLLANSQVGALYPLNWLFWLTVPNSLSGVASALTWSVVLHLWLAVFNVYLLVRDRGCSGWGGALAGLVYVGGGFVGVHVDHLNQLQALAWLPLLLLSSKGQRRFRWLGGKVRLPRALSILAYAMILLAGHTQLAFIALIGLATWHAVLLIHTSWRGFHAITVSRSLRGLTIWLAGLLPFALAALLAGAQLLPTLELALLSGRGTGFEWREALSFSISPWQLHRALLPPYLAAPLLPEGVAYLGTIPLFLAVLGIFHVMRQRQRVGLASLSLMGMGIVLAVGGFNPLYLLAVRLGVPGFAHFRAPARFLALYTLGSVLLVGVGLSQLRIWLANVVSTKARVRRWRIVSLLLVVTIADLAFAATWLPHAKATTPRAYTDLRPATAHLVTASRQAQAEDTAPARFLSMSQTLFELGDKAEIEAAYAGTLSSEALWTYMVATKQREVLAPNLPLAFGVHAVDGYDGGLLPLRSYRQFSELLLPGGTLDGRLRENLAALPERRWLQLLGVQYLLTDKIADVWRDGVLFDLQFQPLLSPDTALTLAWVPSHFPANALGLLYSGGGGEVLLTFEGHRELTYTLPPAWEEPAIRWLSWEEARVLHQITIHGGSDALLLLGASLRDTRLDAFYPLVLSDSYRLVHSGDVKIYADVSPPQRTFLVRDCRQAGSQEAALALMQDVDFDPFQTIVLETDYGVGLEGCGEPGRVDDVDGEESVVVVSYAATEIVLDVVATASGFLVLGDAWYPGWQVQVQPAGQDSSEPWVDPLRANLMFRGVPIEAGQWQVTFSYRPRLMTPGIALSLLGGLSLLAYALYLDR